MSNKDVIHVKYTYEDSTIYEGEVLNDLPNGKGKAFYSGDNVY